MIYLPLRAVRLISKQVKLNSGLSQNQRLSTIASPDSDFKRKGNVEEERYIRRTENERKIAAQQYLDSLKRVALESEENGVDTKRTLYSFQLRDILGVKYKELTAETISHLLAWKMDSSRNNY